MILCSARSLAKNDFEPRLPALQVGQRHLHSRLPRRCGSRDASIFCLTFRAGKDRFEAGLRVIQARQQRSILQFGVFSLAPDKAHVGFARRQL